MSRRVLILGGSGFIGRNLVKYLVENNLASKIRVADKRIPETTGLSSNFTTAFENEKVEFIQANLINAESVAKVFSDPDGDYNIVINVAAETKLSLQSEAYKEGIVDLAVKCANEAVKHNVERFIYVSTAHVYETGDKPKDENGAIAPGFPLAKASFQAEEELRKIHGLNLIVVRPAIVYGPGDVSSLGPRIAVAAIYKKINKVMKLLWGPHLKINTVHVYDVVRALWFLVTNGEVGKIYNLADKNDTDQGKLNAVLEKIFGISTGYKNKLTIQIAARVSMAAVTEEVNSRHIDPWAQICKESGISYSKLTPYLDEEMLYNNDVSVDGSAIEKIGFHYEKPHVTEDEIREMISDYVAADWFPKNYI